MHTIVLFLHITWTPYWHTDSMKKFSTLTRSTILNSDSVNGFTHWLYSDLSIMSRSSFFNHKAMKYVHHYLDYDFSTYNILIVITTNSIKSFQHRISYEFITLTLVHNFNTYTITYTPSCIYIMYYTFYIDTVLSVLILLYIIGLTVTHVSWHNCTHLN